MDFSLRQLQLFCCVVEHKSITKASIELDLTQPAISIQLKKLQLNFEIPLIEILGKKVVITDFGRSFYFQAKDILSKVEDFKYAIFQYAQTTMRNIVGEVTLDELLASRDKIADRIREIVDKETFAWGLSVQNVELKDISLPPDLERVIGRQAEGEREKRAVIITSEGELAASENMAKAASMLASAPGALHLRTLQSINDMSSDQSNTVVFET